jgi:hypothetical protein
MYWFLWLSSLVSVLALSDTAFYPVDPFEWPCVTVQRFDTDCDLFMNTQCDYQTTFIDLNFTAAPQLGWELWRACALDCPANTSVTSRQIGCRDDVVSLYDQSAAVFRNASERISWTLAPSDSSCTSLVLALQREATTHSADPLFVVFHLVPTRSAFTWDTVNQTVLFELAPSQFIHNATIATVVGKELGSLAVRSNGRSLPSVCTNSNLNPDLTASTVEQLRDWSLRKIQDQTVWDAFYVSMLLAFYLQGFHIGMWTRYPGTAAVAHAAVVSLQVPVFAMLGYATYAIALAMAFFLCYIYSLCKTLFIFVIYRDKHFRLPDFDSLVRRRETVLYVLVYYVIQTLLMYDSH